MGRELKASVEIDFSKTEQKLRDFDQRQKADDAKADVTDRRIKRISEQIRESDAKARELQSRVESRLTDMIRDFGKHSVRTIAFNTLSDLSEDLPSRGLAGVFTTGFMTTAMTLNPIEGALAAAAKSIDVLREAQRDYQRQINELRQDFDSRWASLDQFRDSVRKENEQARFAKMKAFEEMRTQVDAEQNELIKRTWLLQEGVN